MIFTDPLKKRRDFNKVFKKGKYYVGRIMTIYVLPNKTDKNCLGVTAVKNFGSSVSRNRHRRLIKENYRLMEKELDKGFNIIFSARKPEEGKMPTFYDVRREMKYLFRKTGILNNNEEQKC